MAVRVRMFAALREAAGANEAAAEPGSLAAILASLEATYGPAFTAVLANCSVLVDGQHMSPQAELTVPDGAEVALLPPFSGGAARCWLGQGGTCG